MYRLLAIDMLSGRTALHREKDTTLHPNFDFLHICCMVRMGRCDYVILVFIKNLLTATYFLTGIFLSLLEIDGSRLWISLEKHESGCRDIVWNKYTTRFLAFGHGENRVSSLH